MSAAKDAMRNGTKIVNDRIDRLGRAVSFECARRLMLATPVDTGRARGNWNLSVGREDPTDKPERRMPEALSEAQGRVGSVAMGTKGDRVYLTNGVPYIGRLNDGYSRQAPAAFVQQVVQAMRSFVQQVAREENARG